MRAICVCGVLIAALTSSWASSPGAQAQAPPAPRRLDLTFNNGVVTLLAEGVTVREIMAEWARRCGCLVQGTDALTGRSMGPLEFRDQPEAVVLDSLLRGAGGYLLGPKPPGSSGASMFGSVSVFQVSRGIEPINVVAAPIAAPLDTGGAPGDEIPPVMPVPARIVQTPPPPPPPPAPPLAGHPAGPAPPAPGHSATPSPSAGGGSL